MSLVLQSLLPYAAHPFWLLRPGGKRQRRRRSGNTLDEIAPSHCRPQGSGLCGLALGCRNYSRELRPAEWGPNVILRSNNPQD